jgi:hypothetical protein
MSPLGVLGNGTSFITPPLFWPLLAVTAAVAIGIGIGKFIPSGKAPDEHLHLVSPSGIHSHCNRADNTARHAAQRAVPSHPVTANSMARPTSCGIRAKRLDLQTGRTGHAICITA